MAYWRHGNTKLLYIQYTSLPLEAASQMAQVFPAGEVDMI